MSDISIKGQSPILKEFPKKKRSGKEQIRGKTNRRGVDMVAEKAKKMKLIEEKNNEEMSKRRK